MFSETAIQPNLLFLLQAFCLIHKEPVYSLRCFIYICIPESQKQLNTPFAVIISPRRWLFRWGNFDVSISCHKVKWNASQNGDGRRQHIQTDVNTLYGVSKWDKQRSCLPFLLYYRVRGWEVSDMTISKLAHTPCLPHSVQMDVM